jgi:hypothetical protein
VSNIKKDYFIHLFSFNKVVSELGSVDEERSAMTKKKKKKKKKRRKKEMSKKNNMSQVHSIKIYLSWRRKRRRKKKRDVKKYEEKKKNPKNEETLEQALQTKTSIKNEKVLYSQNF